MKRTMIALIGMIAISGSAVAQDWSSMPVAPVAGPIGLGLLAVGIVVGGMLTLRRK